MMDLLSHRSDAERLIVANPAQELPLSCAVALLTGFPTRHVADSEALRAACRSGSGVVRLVVISLADVAAAAPLTQVVRELDIPWVATCVDTPEAYAAAFAWSALAAVPDTDEGASALRRLLDGLMQVGPDDPLMVATPQGDEQRASTLKPGDAVMLVDDEVLHLHQGTVSVWALYRDGTEALLGIHSDGAVISAPTDVDWSLRVLARTPSRASRRSRASFTGATATALLDSMERSLAWLAAAVRPSATERLEELLNELVVRVGSPAGDDHAVIDVGITTHELASALGTSRATVVRALAVMRRRGDLGHRGHGPHRRLVLPRRARMRGRA